MRGFNLVLRVLLVIFTLSQPMRLSCGGNFVVKTFLVARKNNDASLNKVKKSSWPLRAWTQTLNLIIFITLFILCIYQDLQREAKSAICFFFVVLGCH